MMSLSRPSKIGGARSGRAADNRSGRCGRVPALAAAALLTGCAGPGTVRGFGAGTTPPQLAPSPAPREVERPVEPRPPKVRPAEARPVEARPAEVRADSPPVEKTPVDPGAERLVGLIAEALDKGGFERRAYTSVRLGPLRNQSRAGAGELEALTRRLAGLLNDAGRARGIEFYTDPEEAVDYELRGTIYLITAQGFDQWELYLSLRPAGEGWSAWRSPGPVRVLRLPVPGAPQIVTP